MRWRQPDGWAVWAEASQFLAAAALASHPRRRGSRARAHEARSSARSLQRCMYASLELSPSLLINKQRPRANRSDIPRPSFGLSPCSKPATLLAGIRGLGAGGGALNAASGEGRDARRAPASRALAAPPWGRKRSVRRTMGGIGALECTLGAKGGAGASTSATNVPGSSRLCGQ